MALVFDQINAGAAQTHALVIGVGGYRYLADGEEMVEQNLENVGLLGQLTSPPLSAAAFAKDMIGRAGRWRAKLGSVELLLSPAPGQMVEPINGVTPERATIAHIRKAFRAWRRRCEARPENMAVLYFCGHGLEKKEQHLLAEDFGADPDMPWLGAFAFDSTRLAMRRAQVDTQLYFIDACRKITAGMLKKEPTAIPLADFDMTAKESPYFLTLKAAAGNEAAFGPKNGVSYFTQALIRALDGAAASQPEGEWVVETGELAGRMTTILRMVKESEGFAGRCAASSVDNTVILSDVEPKVRLTLACDPEAANAAVALRCGAVNAAEDDILKKEGGPWTFEVDPGQYLAEAIFSNGGFKNVKRNIFAMPPLQRPPLKCGLP